MTEIGALLQHRSVGAMDIPTEDKHPDFTAALLAFEERIADGIRQQLVGVTERLDAVLVCVEEGRSSQAYLSETLFRVAMLVPDTRPTAKSTPTCARRPSAESAEAVPSAPTAAAPAASRPAPSSAAGLTGQSSGAMELPVSEANAAASEAILPAGVRIMPDGDSAERTAAASSAAPAQPLVVDDRPTVLAAAVSAAEALGDAVSAIAMQETLATATHPALGALVDQRQGPEPVGFSAGRAGITVVARLACKVVRAKATSSKHSAWMQRSTRF